VVQHSDGTLYVVLGSDAWTLVPDRMGGTDVAALQPIGEIDGTFPNELSIATPAPSDWAG
jgi:hypothetical protein